MSVRTVYELRVITKIGAHADCVRLERFDELESVPAKGAYDRELACATRIVGSTQEFGSGQGGEIRGVVERIVVELVCYKSNGEWTTRARVVGEGKDREGMCAVFDRRADGGRWSAHYDHSQDDETVAQVR